MLTLGDDFESSEVENIGSGLAVKAVNWCGHCNLPFYEQLCPCCGSKKAFSVSDIRPVFPEEQLLLGCIDSLINENEDPLRYTKHTVWCAGNYYIIDGKKSKYDLKRLSTLSYEKIKQIKVLYDQNVSQIDRSVFNENINNFVKTNVDRYNEITEEAFRYISNFRNDFSLDEMFVSFSGGKDSTVVSSLVSRALGTNKVIHIFGDTTLEFPTTISYSRRFIKNPESRGIRVVIARNFEKNFDSLCETIGPPSRVMRWCCTVFKTGAIQRTISSVFKDKNRILSFQGIRHSESVSRSKYKRETESPKISKQVAVAPILYWKDIDVWLYILSSKIDFNDAYKMGYTRVGCWCCPNNGSWSEFLTKVYNYEKSKQWYDYLIGFAVKIGKPDPEEYIASGGWKARQGGYGIDYSKNSIIEFKPCATEINSFNYVLLKPISLELYEFFKPFGTLNFDLGNIRLGEVFVLNNRGEIIIKLKGRIGTTNLKVSILDPHLANARTMADAEKKIKCQITKFQMCINCKACEAVCKFDAISVRNNKYIINENKCTHCYQCINHYVSGFYMREVLCIKRN